MGVFYLTQERAEKMYEQALTIWSICVPAAHYAKLAELHEWKIKLGAARKEAGSCDYTNKRIVISTYVAQYLGADATMNTMLHEVLHLIFPRDGHKGDWLKYANLFNTSDHTKLYRDTYGMIKRTYCSAQVKKEYIYALHCDGCKQLIKRYLKKSKVITRVEAARANKKPIPYRCGWCKSTDLRVEVLL